MRIENHVTALGRASDFFLNLRGSSLPALTLQIFAPGTMSGHLF